MHRRQPPSARNAANPSGNEAASFNTPLSDLTAFWFSAMAAIKTIAPSPTSVEPRRRDDRALVSGSLSDSFSARI